MFSALVSLRTASPISVSAWVPPFSGSFKINVDFAFFPTPKNACLGMVVPDHQGISHLSVATRVDNIDSALHAKLKAIPFGLEKASDFQFPFLTVESDSLLVIKEIEKQ